MLFVYGSLMRGLSNHARLRASRLVGHARTEPRFTLLSLGAYPALVTGGATRVHGELYEVDAEVLAELDRFEGHPRLYRRTAVPLEEGGAGAEAYVLAKMALARGARPVPSGDWRAELATGA